MNKAQYLAKIGSLRERISEMQRLVKQYEDEVKRIDAARCTRLLEIHHVDPDELEFILKSYRKKGKEDKLNVDKENKEREEAHKMQEEIVFPRELLSEGGDGE